MKNESKKGDKLMSNIQKKIPVYSHIMSDIHKMNNKVKEASNNALCNKPENQKNYGDEK